jgi:hypothetical protein
MSKKDLNEREKLVKCYIWSIAFYGAESWTLVKVYQKCMESFKMFCWRRMEKKIWTVRVRNEGVLHKVNEESNVLHTIRRTKNNWIGHSLRRNFLLKHVIGGKIEGGRPVTEIRG